MRVIEWLVIAGVIGLLRRSLPRSGSSSVAGSPRSSSRRATYDQRERRRCKRLSHHDARVPGVHPPARVARLPLSGGTQGKLRVLPAPRFDVCSRDARVALLGVAALVLAVVPLAVIAAANPLRGPNPRAYEVDILPRTVDPALGLDRVTAGRPRPAQLERDPPSEAKVFYRIWRTARRTAAPPARPSRERATTARSRWTICGRTSGRPWVDRPGTGHVDVPARARGELAEQSGLRRRLSRSARPSAFACPDVSAPACGPSAHRAMRPVDVAELDAAGLVIALAAAVLGPRLALPSEVSPVSPAHQPWHADLDVRRRRCVRPLRRRNLAGTAVARTR